MPSYVNLKPTARPWDRPDVLRLTGSMKRGGVGACFKICQEPWVLDGHGHTETRMFPSRQLSRIGDVAGYLAAGVGVLKLQGRSLPPRALGPLVSRYRQAIDAALAGGSPPEPGESPLPSMWTVIGR
jgi:hypothetical protein